MPAFRLTAKAKEDLRGIGRWSQQQWGREQRDRYLAQLDRCFRLLAETPGLGRPCDEVRVGYRRFHEGRHLLFYRGTAQGIEIVRILHERMDPARHL
jgi:toxin ParE1/3/4